VNAPRQPHIARYPPRNAVQVAERLHLVAANLEAGRREDATRLITPAIYAETNNQIRPLLRFLVQEALAQLDNEPAPPSMLQALLARAAYFLASPASDWHVQFRLECGDAILQAAPYRRRRRHSHCHGQVASDRRWLLVREILDGCTPAKWLVVWWAIAYTISNYDRNHFVMQGAEIAPRLRRLAAWLLNVPPNPEPEPDELDPSQFKFARWGWRHHHVGAALARAQGLPPPQ
jgi:hypothetical protein